MKRLLRKKLIGPLFSGAINFFPGQMPHFLVNVDDKKAALNMLLFFHILLPVCLNDLLKNIIVFDRRMFQLSILISRNSRIGLNISKIK